MRTAIGVLCLLFAVPAQARIVSLQITDQVPFADGAAFGTAGAYVRIRAIAKGELDPASPSNAAIALLDKAPRNSRGMVEYDTDVVILRPADPALGSHVMLYDVLNRGNKYIPSWLNDAAESAAGMVNDPLTVADAGNRFTFRRGYTMVWSGWQPEAPLANAGMRIRVPVATDGGRPIVQRIRNEMVVGTRGPEGAVRLTLPYKVGDITGATLTRRAAESDAPVPIAINDWRWLDHQTIELKPWPTAWTPRDIYDLSYDATEPTVDGIGFAAVRDVVSYLRPQDGTQHVLGFGVSLSGRFLRHFLDLGMNRDEAGHRVFDGMLPHIGGAGKVFANEAFAMPGRTATQHEDRFYPEVWQPIGYGPAAVKGGLLRDPATDPKVIESNTSTEYWQKGASLVHTDAAGHDVELPDGVRMMMIAGTQHGGHSASIATPQFCATGRNPNSAGPALRAMMVNLEDWVVRGIAPPPSQVPRLADETGVPASALRMPAVPGIIWAPRDNPIGAPVDWVTPPAKPQDPMSSFVAAVDMDGNEVAGIRLPNVAVPLGTSTGVSVYRDMPGELCDRDGIYLPFARTKAERETSGDPRLSLAERYTGREDYVAKVAAASATLVKARLLLQEDADRYVAAARVAPGF